MHPAGALVEALVDEELAPGHGAVGVEPFVADHLQFGAEEERGVGIDQQQGVVVGGVRGRDGDAVRAGRLGRVAIVDVGESAVGESQSLLPG